MAFEYETLSKNKFILPNKWTVVPIKSVADVNELTINKNYPYKTIRYIDIASVDKGRINSIQELDRKQSPSRAKRIVRNNDILISTVRPNLEHYVYIKNADMNAVASTGFAVITAKSMNSRYLYYYLITKHFTEYLTRIAESSTSTYPAFNPDIIEKANIVLPGIKEQDVIADILGALDDRIELNRQINYNLKQLTRVLFKSWFVDFDPVISKISGKQPFGMTKDVASLFSNCFVDSELGQIPKSWKVGSNQEVIKISKKSLNPSKYPEEIFYHYSIPAFDQNKYPAIDKGNQINSNKYLVIDKAVLISKLNPETERVWLPISFNNKKAICSTEFMVCVAKENCSQSYIYSYFLDSQFQREFCSLVTGTSKSHQRVKPDDFLNMKAIIPDKNIIACFDKIVSNYIRQIIANDEEIQNLAELRDTLLPKLLSGEVRVKQAEKIVSEAV